MATLKIENFKMHKNFFFEFLNFFKKKIEFYAFQSEFLY
jgi:hypothetical protein